MGFVLLLFDISGGELILIIMVVVLLFGPSKLPQIIKQYKAGISKLNAMKEELTNSLQNEQNPAIEKETEDKISDIIENYKSSNVERQNSKGNNSVVE